MNIYAKEGHKVKAVNFNAGYSADQSWAKEHLVQDAVYTVDHTDVGGWRTDVYLKEKPGMAFNSVHFEDYVESEV